MKDVDYRRLTLQSVLPRIRGCVVFVLNMQHYFVSLTDYHSK